MNFRKKVTESVKIKTLHNQRLNGDMYCTMISSYVNAINEGAVPNIENAWMYMCEEQCQKALDDCYELFIREMKEGFRDFPKPEEDFNKCVYAAEEKAISFAYAFCGVRIQCAQCHKHPFDQWSKQDFDQFERLFDGIVANQNSYTPSSKEDVDKMISDLGLAKSLKGNDLRKKLHAFRKTQTKTILKTKLK